MMGRKALRWRMFILSMVPFGRRSRETYRLKASSGHIENPISKANKGWDGVVFWGTRIHQTVRGENH